MTIGYGAPRDGGQVTPLAIHGALDAAAGSIDLVVTDHIVSVDTPHERSFDASGLTALPGFIDIQTNGGVGYDFTRDPSSIWDVGAWLPSTGVTAFCPTIITAREGAISRAQAVLGARPPGYNGAEPLGLHIEGPHLSEARHGTHPVALLRPPGDWSATVDHLSIVTVAPELPGALDLIRELSAQGVVVSIGHSAATTRIARAAIDAGATLGTHLFNGMDPIGGREPGIAGVLLTDERARFGMIVDDVHLAPETVRLAWAAAPDRLVLITDAVAAAGMPDGTYEIGGIDVTLRNGAVRNSNGDLAGSSLTMDAAVRNLMAITGTDLASASRCASDHPGAALGLDDRRDLLVGSVADIVFMDGTTVVATVVRGDVVFNTEPDRSQGRDHAAS